MKEATEKMNDSFASELIILAQQDESVRQKLLRENKLAKGYNAEMEIVHRRNAARLREIIEVIGWPAISKVGAEASEAAWLIVQHSIGEPAFMKRCLALIQESRNDVNPQNEAFLYDRIMYFEGRPQKYGTQFDDRGLYPVNNKVNVNELRRELGLKPHRESIITEHSLDQNSHDLHQDPEFNTWRRRVGWI